MTTYRFSLFNNVCTEDLYNVKTMSSSLIYRWWWEYKANFQNNDSFDNLLITKTTEYGRVEANQYDIGAPLHREQKATTGSWWVSTATELRFVLRHNQHLEWMQNLMLFLCWYYFVFRNFYIMVGFLWKHFSSRKNRYVVNGHAKTSNFAASPFLNIIKFHAVSRLERQ